jgi:mucin-19
MAVIYSSDLKLSIISTGTEAGVWGQITNTNLYLLQQAIGGYEAISIAGGAQTTALTMSNGTISNARNAVIKLTGTITGNQIVTVPNGVEKTYIVSNGTTGAFTVEFKTASGTGPTFSTTDKGIKILFADGTNVVDVNANFSASSFPQINDSNGNEEIKFTTTASAVNEFTITNAATANAPEISATGGDTNIDIKITPKGSGKINLDGIKFPNADGSSGQFLKTDGSGILSFADSGLAWQSVVTTSTITVVAGRAYFINTTSNACTVTLPSTPTAGQQVQLVDYAGTFDTNTCTINPNGNKLEGGTANLQLTGEREGVILTYIDSTQGWLATSGINEGTDALSPVSYSADFLVIAGGGAGGFDQGGGGGAGGYRSSNATYGSSGGGGSAESSLTFGTGVVYTITVGAGGAGIAGFPSGGNSNPGNNSSISGTGISTITSTGGGRGGLYNTPGNSGIGGSGGGEAGQGGTGAAGTANQGYAGGNGVSGSGAGGGGAGAVGISGTSGTIGGAGGNGVASTITGSSVTRGGGGGGNALNNTNGPGGSGGGGSSSNNQSPGSNGGDGTANTGGGGGGTWFISSPVRTGNGGSGVVILRMPTANYSGTTTGSPTVSTSGSNTILTFTASGTYTG